MVHTPATTKASAVNAATGCAGNVRRISSQSWGDMTPPYRSVRAAIPQAPKRYILCKLRETGYATVLRYTRTASGAKTTRMPAIHSSDVRTSPATV